MQKFHLYKAWVSFFRHTCRTFFAASSENICPIYCFVHSSSQSVTQWNCIFSFKIHWIQMLHLFHTWDGPFFFHRHTCRAFFAVSSKNIYPTYCFGHSSSQSVSQWNSFSPLKYIVYKCFSCFRPGMAHFFSSSHLSRFFCCIIRKYLSHILYWSQLVSVCFAMKFFSSFKIHCLQMLQLFQTRDGPIFFHRHTCLHLSCFFLLYHQKIFVPYIVLVTARLSLFRNEILFLL